MVALALFQEQSRLQSLLAAASSDPLALAFTLAIAFFLGAAHALSPGHGKTIVAAYLAGTRGRLIDAFFLGGVVTVAHTASVFVLGLSTLYASQRVDLDRIYPKLSLASGILVSLVGLWLLLKRWRGLQGHDHPHPHNHHHPHERPGRGSLLSLGISGGMVPCPEALVVLLLAISLRRVGFGLLLLVAFTLGLAAVLIAIGCAIVLAGPLLHRLGAESGWVRRLPVVSAAVVTAAGLMLVVQAAEAL